MPAVPAEIDIVYFVEPGFSGGTSRAVAEEITALARAGIVPGWCPVQSPVFGGAVTPHPALAGHLASGAMVCLDPRLECRAKVALIHHPLLFQNLPPEPLGLRADHVVLVLHHPPLNGFHQPNYDLVRICANIEETFGADVLIAPVSPTVRAMLQEGVLPRHCQLLDEDWLNLLDFAAWPVRPVPRDSGPLIIGRHSRPQFTKFPDSLAEALLAYPQAPDLAIRMLGAADLAKKYGPLPTNWQLLPFNAQPVPEFLQGLDLYIYQHGREWVEAFGYGVLEAVASGVPVITTRPIAALFGPHVRGADPAEIPALITAFRDQGLRESTARAARAHAEARFGLDQFLPRLGRLVPGFAAAHRRPPPVPRPPKVVMMSSNGVGLGHLTRLMAIAARLPEGSQVSFFTMSQAYRLAIEAGYPVQFVPHHRATGAEPGPWNLALAEELGDFLDLARPDILVFDGNVPYAGLLSALNRRPWLRRVWVRRALWGADKTKAGPLSDFDLVLEPGEVSQRFDTGPAAGNPSIQRVSPVLHDTPDRWLDRDTARAALGLGPGIAVGVMLGAGTNFDLSGIRSAILADLSGRRDVEVVEIVPPLSQREGREEPHRKIALYPAARYARAFDFMVTSAGYNSFHEAMLGGVPSVFVPNEAEEMDRQLLRARHAKVIGCAEILRSSDRIGIGAVLDRMCDPQFRLGMRDRMQRLAVGDGAAEAAAAIVALQPLLRMRSGL